MSDGRLVLASRSALAWGARLALLAGPIALAFWSGGYFDSPRAVAGLVAWALVAAALLAGQPLPRTASARLALTGIGLLAAWTLSPTLWAPLAGSAYHAGQRVVLDAGVLLAAATLLRPRAALRAVEAALAAGTLVVIGYGISDACCRVCCTSNVRAVRSGAWSSRSRL